MASHMTQGPLSQPAGPAQQNAHASRPNRGGPSIKAMICGSCFELCVFSSICFFFKCLFANVFGSGLQQPGTRFRVITRRLPQPFQHWRSSNMCFSSQQGVTDAESLHNRYLELARAGLVNHGEEDHFGGEVVRSVEVPSSSEMLRYDAGICDGPCVTVILQRCDKFEILVQVRASVSAKSVASKGKDLFATSRVARLNFMNSETLVWLVGRCRDLPKRASVFDP